MSNAKTEFGRPTMGGVAPGTTGGVPGSVGSVTAGNGSIVIGGSPVNPTVVVNLGAATLPYGPALGGASLAAARVDHQHPSTVVADLAALAALPAATWNSGGYVYVTTLRSWFRLDPAGASVAAPAVRVAASGKPGFLWFREALSPAWWNQLTWFITSAALAGTDEGDGASAPNAISPQEYRRRHLARWLPGIETASVVINVVADLGDNDYIQVEWSVGLRGLPVNFTIQGAQTVVATGLITADTPINRATNTPNSITAGFAWAAHVGRMIRLQGTTTTTAWVVKDLGANTARLSEESVAGVTGPGFATGQTVEVVTLTKVPGIHVIGPSQILMNDCSINPAAVASLKLATIYANFVPSRVQFAGGASTNTIQSSNMTATACAFVTRAWQCLQGTSSYALCAQIDQPTIGLAVGGIVSLTSHFSQASTITENAGTFAQVSGAGSANIGFFDLAAAQIGVNLLSRAHFDSFAMWGSGNNASSIQIQVLAGASLAGMVAANFTIAGGLGVQMNVGPGTINIPVTELPHRLGAEMQPTAASKFTGALVASAIGATLSYMADPGTNLALGNVVLPQRYPISERLALRLRVTKRAGAVLTNAATATVYKNNVATTMTVSIPAADAINTKYVDSAHPTLFNDGDDFDVRLDDAADVLAGTLLVSAQIEWSA